jgi:rhodanese-related sulfurtransferase
MKKSVSFVILFGFGLLLNFVYADPVETIKATEALKLQSEKKAIIVDVRDVDEFNEGIVKDAQTISFSSMNEKRDEWEKKVANLPKDKTIILYCKVGGRANKVGIELLKKGFKVRNMGGYDSWKDAGLPIEKR